MSRYLALGCLGLGLMVSPLFGLQGAQSAVPANQKIGIIDIENTLSTTPAGKRANEQFEKQRKAKQADLDKKKNEALKAKTDLEKQQAVLKPEVFKQKYAELEKRFVELQQTYVQLERELAADRAKLIQDLMKQAEPRIDKIAKAEGVSIILDQNAVVWAEPAVNLTKKLNDEMK